ncbi:MAG: hypothetical protein MUC96_07225 [Myxococcaceae bacterium]|nr:hypothetical protein [Myxococcaceae bacterium]
MLGLLLSMSLVALPAPSQTVEGRHQAWVNAGFASTWLVQAGGGFRLGEGVRLDVQLDTPLVRPLVMGGRLALGLSVLRPFGDWFGLAGRVELGAPWSNDFSGSWLAIDGRAGLQPGIYRRTWAVALDVSVVPTLAASWTPSLVVRDSFGDRPGSAVQSPRAVGLSFPAFRVDVGALARFRLVKTDVARLWLLVNASLVVTPSQVGPAMPPTSTLPFTMGLGAACEL